MIDALYGDIPVTSEWDLDWNKHVNVGTSIEHHELTQNENEYLQGILYKK